MITYGINMIVRKRLIDVPYFILGALLVYFLGTHSANINYDTPTYINFDPTRPPVYPIFVWMFRWAGPCQYSLIMWVQGIFLFVTLLYARYWLKKNLYMLDFAIFLVFFVTMITISFHYQISYIQSEGLTFPFFILTFFLLIECFQKFNLKKIFYLALLVNLLVLTRLQFYYFYVIFIILCTWYLWWRLPIKKLSITILILFGSMMFTIIADHSYHYFKHGSFAGGSYGGLMILVQALYLADNNAASYFKDANEKNYIQVMIDQRNAKTLNQNASLIITLRPSYLNDAYKTYATNYLSLLAIIESTLEPGVKNKMGKKSIYKTNAIATNLSKIIISREYKKNLVFLLWKFVECTGGIPLFLFFLMLLISIPYKIIKDGIRSPDVSLLFVTIMTIIIFCNAAMIALCNPDLPPYFCYSQFLFYCLAGFLVNETLFRNKKL